MTFESIDLVPGCDADTTNDACEYTETMYSSVRHVKFSKKNAGQRATTSFQPAIFTRVWGARDTYTMNLKIHFKVMVWITVISTVNREDFLAGTSFPIVTWMNML